MADAQMISELPAMAPRKALTELHQEHESVIPFKPLLALHDVLVPAFAGVLGIWLVGAGFARDASIAQNVFLLCIGMIPVAFFRGFRLYDYHLIYAPPYHLLGMCKAFLLSLSTGVILLIFYSGPVSIPQSLLLPAVAALVVGSLVVGRLLWDHFIALLKPVGLACIIVGAAELISFRDGPFAATNLPSFLGAISAAPVSAPGPADRTQQRCRTHHRSDYPSESALLDRRHGEPLRGVPVKHRGSQRQSGKDPGLGVDCGRTFFPGSDHHR